LLHATVKHAIRQPSKQAITELFFIVLTILLVADRVLSDVGHDPKQIARARALIRVLRVVVIDALA